MADDVRVGAYLQDHIGHYVQVLAILTPWCYRVQALTPVDPPGTLVPIGAPFIMGRSELRIPPRA